jgi:RNA 3'-terminal phosphate cyclase (ATP)
MLTIDGSFGEGGGQVLRSSLSLSLLTGRPFRIHGIRAGRSRPGLLRQHLTAVSAAREISSAVLSGAEMRSQDLRLEPDPGTAGEYRFSVGTAGSATLVLQTVLPALLLAPGPSELVIEGGTHNPFAPPFDFLDRVFLPVVERMGPRVKASLDRPGFYPAGGGRFTVSIEPVERLSPLDILERGRLEAVSVKAVVAGLSAAIADRELRAIKKHLDVSDLTLERVVLPSDYGPGNIVTAEVRSDGITELFTGFGERGVRAETISARVAEQVNTYLATGSPAGEYLADQLLLLMAVAGGGAFRTARPLSRHAQTQREIICRFLEVSIEVADVGEDALEVRVANTSSG